MHVAFNQDSSCCVVGTSHGFRVYNCSPFGRFYSSQDAIGVMGAGLAQMLFSTSLIVVVGNGEFDSPRKLSVVNTRRSAQSAIICELTFPTAMRAVRLNRQRLVVVLDSQIYIYNLANMKLLHTLDTVNNRDGVADVTPNAGTGRRSSTQSTTEGSNPAAPTTASGNWLVYPAGPPLKHHLAPTSTTNEAQRAPQGDVVVFDLDLMSPITVIRAHRSPLAVLALNEDGSLLATTSDRGTLIRVFSVPSSTLLYEFRRGSYHSRVFSLAFSLGSKLLCVSSSTQTVHIYKLDAAHRIKGSHRPDPRRRSLGNEDDTLSEANVSSSLKDDEDNEDEADRDLSLAPEDEAGDSLGLSNDLPPSEHIGSAPENTNTNTKQPKSKSSWFSRSAWTDAARVHRTNPRSRDFAWFKLPLKQNTRTVVSIAPLSSIVYVATENGKLFHYKLDLEKGGECKKIAEFALD